MMGNRYHASREVIRDYYNRVSPAVVQDMGYSYQGATLKNVKVDPYRETNEWQAERAGIKPGMRVLDAGCGACGPATDIARRFEGVVIDAVTLSEEQAKAGRGLIAKLGLEGRVNVHVGDYHHLPFADGTYDVVYFFESSGYSDEKPNLYREMFRLLKPGGRLYIKDMFMKDDPTEFEQYGIDAYNEAYASNADTLKATMDAVTEAGFVDVEGANRMDVYTLDHYVPAMVKFENGKMLLDETGKPVLTDLGKLHDHPYYQQNPDRSNDPIYFGEVRARKP